MASNNLENMGDLEELFNSMDLTDVKFLLISEDGDFSNIVTVQAHKNILSMASPVFKEMFKEQNEVEITANSDAVQNMIKFVYTNSLAGLTNWKTGMDTLGLARRFQLEDLEKAAINAIGHFINENHVFEVLSSALKLLECKEILNKCAVSIAEKIRYNRIGFFEATVDVSYEVWHFLLNQNFADMQPLDWFRALLKWSENECERDKIKPTPTNCRLICRDLLFYIRYQSISKEDMWQVVIASGLLSNSEAFEIFKGGESIPFLWAVPQRRTFCVWDEVKLPKRTFRCTLKPDFDCVFRLARVLNKSEDEKLRRFTIKSEGYQDRIMEVTKKKKKDLCFLSDQVFLNAGQEYEFCLNDPPPEQLGRKIETKEVAFSKLENTNVISISCPKHSMARIRDHMILVRIVVK